MSVLTWITLAAIGGVVWGGLCYFISLALRSERLRQRRVEVPGRHGGE